MAQSRGAFAAIADLEALHVPHAQVQGESGFRIGDLARGGPP